MNAHVMILAVGLATLWGAVGWFLKGFVVGLAVLLGQWIGRELIFFSRRWWP